ncbi:MAG: SNF2-related protein [Peptococcaceae bacterium]|nr:SNF2-related protein [Peptococcaceae bacterium]
MCALSCLESLNFSPLPHQIHTADRVVNQIGGRAILADEVGLGKTIEAGIIVKELIERKQVERVLILTPASLAPQWCMEMRDKFALYFYHNRRDHNWTYFSFIVASIDRAKRSEQLKAISQAGFDLLIVDEAHRLKNCNTANYKAVQQIAAKYLLLLTATPLHNNLKELYNLIELVKPGFSGDYTRFAAEFETEGEHRLNSVMIRNLKSELQDKLPPRSVELVPITLTSAERDLYAAVNSYIKWEYRRRRNAKLSVLNLILLQREICSSSFAAQATLAKMGLDELAARAAGVKHNSKADAVYELLQRDNGRTIIFTQFKATQAYLYDFLAHLGVNALCYNGDLKAWQRVWMRDEFQQSSSVLISTEAGGEGINLQGANTVINYDLPWNPMRVEQRIGRVHRLGQTQTVQVYNLYAQDTVEELIVASLREKIAIFNTAVGELDRIIDNELEPAVGLLDYWHGVKVG